MQEQTQGESSIEAEVAERLKHGPWSVAIGTIVVVNEIPMKLVNVNTGKRRLTFSPLEGMPMCTVVSDPIMKVTKPRR